jgi:hypothetical protein
MSLINILIFIKMSKIPTYWFNFLQSFYQHVNANPLFKSIPKLTNKKCVLIEPRKHPLLKYVIYNFMYFLQPKGWGLHIVCGTDNHDFVLDCCKEMSEVTTYILPFDNLNEPLYNYLLTSPGFYKSIPDQPEHILIFQTDTLLLKDNVDDYLKWDYVGAPWQHTLQISFQAGKAIGMNGGLSLRNLKKMIDVCKERSILKAQLENEDGWICFKNHDMLILPTLQEAFMFSVETCWPGEYIPTGMHATYKFQSEERIIKCLDLVIMELKK